MVKFCHEFFGTEDVRCSTEQSDEVAAAINLAWQASQEIRDQWEATPKTPKHEELMQEMGGGHKQGAKHD